MVARLRQTRLIIASTTLRLSRRHSMILAARLTYRTSESSTLWPDACASNSLACMAQDKSNSDIESGVCDWDWVRPIGTEA